MRHSKLTTLIGLIAFLGLTTYCSPTKITNSGPAASTSGSSSALSFVVTANPAYPNPIAAGGTAQITAHVVDSLGNAAPDGTVVNFSLDYGLKGTLSSLSQETVGGIATVTFTAGNYSTIAVITAKIGVGSTSANAYVSIVGTIPASILVSANPTSTNAGGTSTITAAIMDGFGFALSGVIVSFSTNPTNASLSATAAITDANSVATVTLTGVAGPSATVFATCLGTTKSVVVNISGSTLSSSIPLPIAMSVAASPTSISTGSTSQITAHVVDATGNLVPDGTVVNFSLDNGLKGVLANMSQATTGGNATVTFTAGIYSTIAIVKATIGSASASTSVSIVGTTLGSVVVSAATPSIVAGGTTVITATVTDGLGFLLPGATVSFSTDPLKASLSPTTAQTNVSGVAGVTLTGVAVPSANVIATCLGATGSALVNISGSTIGSSIPLPLAMSVTASPASISTGASSLITAHVVDATGNPVPDGTAVQFSLDNGLKGVLSAVSQVTSGGNATVNFTAGTQSAIAVITAAIGSTNASANISIVGTVPANVVVSAGTTSITAGGTSVITAEVTDSLGKIVAGATVTFSITDPTKGALSSTTARTDVNGQASVTLTGAAGPYATVNAACLGAQGSVTVNISGTGSVGSIAISSTLTSLDFGANATITVLLRDASGLPITNATLNFSLSNAAAGSLSAPTAVTNSSGVATVSFTAGSVPTSGIVSATYATLGLSSEVNLTIIAPPPAAIVTLTTPTSITVRGTSTITAVVTDANGHPVLNGTLVTFSLSDSSYGSLSNNTSSTSGGIATVTFTAASRAGSITVSALAGTVSNTATVTITPAPTGSIQFISAYPQLIGIQGSGVVSTSTITFKVNDINGFPVTDGTPVTFKMLGPGGGAYIGSSPGSATATGSTVNGFAVVILNSGTVAGPVTIIASTSISGGGSISTSSGQISIGGGVPSATNFNLATSQFNLQGFVVSGLTASITAFIADRFGNYNILQGTSISFYTEAGAIAAQGITDATGKTTVALRTQAPMPAMVAPRASEMANIAALNTKYSAGIPTDGSVHPRNGWVTVMAAVQGEESFLDENGSGVFIDSYTTLTPCPVGYTCECDGGNSTSILPTDVTRTCAGGSARSEAFIDLGEPFVDYNDDGCRNDGITENCTGVVSSYPTPTDPFEPFIDTNGNGVYDPPNGVWDGPNCAAPNCEKSKTIWTSIKLAFTGNEQYCGNLFSPSNGFTVGSGMNFSFMVGDFNTNQLIPGTVITVAAYTETAPPVVIKSTNYTVPDGVPNGPTEVSLFLPASAGTPGAGVTIIGTVASSGILVCAPQVINGTF